MKRLTVKTFLLILVSTWICVLLQAFMTRQIAPDMISAFESMGSSLPTLSKPFIYFLLSSFVYILPALTSLVLILVEISVKSERSRLVVQVVYTCIWLGFITINYIALFLPVWKWFTPIGSWMEFGLFQKDGCLIKLTRQWRKRWKKYSRSLEYFQLLFFLSW